MAEEAPVIYMYLLTHVYLYETEFGTRSLGDSPGRAAVEEAAAELLAYVPLALQPHNARRIFNGVVPDHADARALSRARWDVVCEAFFTLTRVYGQLHPVVEALAVRVEEFLDSDEGLRAASDPSEGHLRGVCFGAWRVWQSTNATAMSPIAF